MKWGRDCSNKKATTLESSKYRMTYYPQTHFLQYSTGHPVNPPCGFLIICYNKHREKLHSFEKHQCPKPFSSFHFALFRLELEWVWIQPKHIWCPSKWIEWNAMVANFITWHITDKHFVLKQCSQYSEPTTHCHRRQVTQTWRSCTMLTMYQFLVVCSRGHIRTPIL